MNIGSVHFHYYKGVPLIFDKESLLFLFENFSFEHAARDEAIALKLGVFISLFIPM